MPAFRRTVGSFGQVEHVNVSDELAPAYRANPAWVEVVEVDADLFVPVDKADDVRAALEERQEVEEQVADLKGDKLAAAAKKAGLPTTLTADETRAALIEHRLAPAPDADDFDTQES